MGLWVSPMKPWSAGRAAASARSLAMIWAGVIPADGGVEGVLVGGAAVAVVGALTAEAHVDDLDVVGGGVLSHPVEAADHVGQAAGPEGGEDPHGVERRAGRDADDTHPGVLGGHD